MALQQTLRALCLNNGWCYAVFWKLKRRSRMVLTWEDGYYDHTKPSPVFNRNALLLPPATTRNCLPEQIGLTVAKMSYQVYSLGEGVIGRVAFTGKHQWVFANGGNNTNQGGSNVQLVTEKYPAEWQNQFSAGIKTIAVIAVSQGVVQLGSTQMIMEDMGWVDKVRTMFGTLQGVREDFPSDLFTHRPKLKKGNDDRSLTTASTLTTTSSVVSASSNRSGVTGYLTDLENMYMGIEFNSRNPSTRDSNNGGGLIDIEIPQRGDNLGSLAALISSSSRQIITPLSSTDIGKKELPNYPNQGFPSFLESQLPTYFDAPSLTWNDTFSQSIRQEEHIPIVEGSIGNVSFEGLDQTQVVESSMPTIGELDELEKLLSSSARDLNKAWGGDASTASSFVIGDELSQALGPAFQKKPESMPPLGHSMFQKKPENLSPPICPSSRFGIPQTFACIDEVSGGIMENFSCRSALSGMDSTIPNMSSKVELILQGFENKMMTKTPCMPPAARSSFNKEMQNNNSSSASVIYSSLMDGCGSESQGFKSEIASHSPHVMKSEESGAGKGSRKRARPGESGKPRPKDRQQIQDRVRELREIIPNGSKCSIDSLLEKTIKHMLFLQSVTHHADVLRQSGDIKADAEIGTSGALELHGHGMECPIRVENLKQPCQMLVEMLCEERGLFLEIADTIRGLGLTILKGVIESRTDKVWARFIVEATADVHRVDIVLALMHLLQPEGKEWQYY